MSFSLPESHVDISTTTSVESLPDYLQELIGRDNENFEDWLREMVSMRTRNVEAGRTMQQEIQTIYKQIHPEDGKVVVIQMMMMVVVMVLMMMMMVVVVVVVVVVVQMVV